jgi:hypothetical protein
MTHSFGSCARYFYMGPQFFLELRLPILPELKLGNCTRDLAVNLLFFWALTNHFPQMESNLLETFGKSYLLSAIFGGNGTFA